MIKINKYFIKVNGKNNDVRSHFVFLILILIIIKMFMPPPQKPNLRQACNTLNSLGAVNGSALETRERWSRGTRTHCVIFSPGSGVQGALLLGVLWEHHTEGALFGR